MPGNFLDSNVLIYTTGSDAKRERAREVVAAGGTISVQVLNEVANVARRKLALTWDETHRLLRTLRDLFDIQPINLRTHEIGLVLAERYRLSIYDAMIAAAALQADCDTLLTEDMQHGAVLDGRLRIVNPFRPS